MDEGSVESSMMVLHDAALGLDSIRTDERKEEENLSSNKEINPPPLVCPCKLPIPFPYRVAWSKLSKLEPRFT